MSLAGCTDRDAAEALRGTELCVDRSELPPLEAGEYYLIDLVGLEARLPDGTVVGTVDQTVTVPLQATGTCQILHLELGPLDLDLLGLVVHLDRVVLDITAEQGSVNLLGNLLCGIAGLLDGDAPGNVIARLLNQLLGLLS